MTLKEAYELQRKELIALRNEVKKLRGSSVTVKEKEGLEKELRKLKASLAAAEKRFYEVVEEKLAAEKKAERLENELQDSQAHVISLISKNEKLALELKTAETELEELKGANKKLMIQAGKDFTNSSFPSSAQVFRKKIPNSRKPTGRKPGAQPGHRPYKRKAVQPSATKKIADPSRALDPDCYRTEQTIHKQLIDISIHVKVIDYVADVFRMRSTGSRFHGAFPDGVRNEVNYGPGVKALAFFLNNYCNVSILKTSELLSSLTGGAVSPSAGMVSSLVREFSAQSESDRLKIFRTLLDEKVLYSDATVGNVNGKRKAVFISRGKDCALYQGRDTKGHAGIAGTPVEKASHVVVHDHDKTFYAYGTAHQECLAHVLRYLESAIENEAHLTWHKKMQTLLREMIHYAKKNPEGRSPENQKVRGFRKKYRDILNQGKEEYKEHPPAKEFHDGYNLCCRMLEYMDAHLYFLSHPEVDWSNNVSERGLRKFKRKQKQAVVFRSMAGMTLYCDALTIIETARIRGENPFETVRGVFEKGHKNSR